MAAFADVVLRGLALTGQAIAVGGVLFVLLVLRATETSDGRSAVAPPLRRAWTLVALGAVTIVLTQTLSLAVLKAATGADFQQLAATMFVEVGLTRVSAALVLAVAAFRAGRRSPGAVGWAVILVASVVVVLGAAAMGHGAARLEHRARLITLDAIHQLAAAAWIGGLGHLIATLKMRGRSTKEPPIPTLKMGGRSTKEPPIPPSAVFIDDRARVATLRRFSTLAVASVAVLIAGGIGLSLSYVDGVKALLGTAYGVMVLTKVVILVGLLGLGALNFMAVRRWLDASSPLPRVRRFVEAELGLGITVLFAAASLTSLPPAIDVVDDRATLSEVATRFTPQWPRLTSPPISELPVDDPDAPRTDADRAWSEYNHHVSGLFVLTMGVLAVLHVSGVRWARHWPLVLLGLAAFMFVRNDPGAWPLGPQGFWASLREPSVLQHRLFVVLVVAFGIFEWMVRTRRLVAAGYALIFPILCAVGGGLLLTHSHASVNLKAEFLVEVTHAPMGVLGIAIGWARWLEVRLAPPDDRIPSRIWSSAMALFGILLLLYRES